MTDSSRLGDQAEAAIAKGDIATARTLLQKALAQDDCNVRLIQLAAQTAEMGGQSKMAVQLLRTAMQLEPHNRATIATLFRLCLADGNLAGAEQLMARDHATAGIDVQHLWLRSQLALANGQEEHAEQHLADLLAQEPQHQDALAMQARLAMRRGRAEAPALFERAREKNLSDVALLRDHARALASQGDYAAALEALGDTKADNPLVAELITDHIALLSEAGREKEAEDALAAATEQARGNSELRIALADLIMQQDRPAEALAMLAGQRQANVHPEVRLTEARAAGMAGELDHAERLLAGLDESRYPIPPLTLARHLIRRRRFGDAENLLQKQLERHGGDISAWALIDCIWRVTGQNEKHLWLHDPDKVTANLDLGMSADDIEVAANWLRAQHKAKAAPTGQSLRHGTQTGGAILTFDADMARLLRDRIAAAVNRFISGWPEQDSSHPLFRWKKQAWRFRGSWSVRLTDGGHHKPHIHPEGHISSASYWVLPDESDTDRFAGWFELGRPPHDLALDIEPSTSVRPQAGHLVLFPSTFYHGTQPFGLGERMTLAFDVNMRRS
ncbi:tetratricopeptide repeat protein [Alterisphingorhabdus coralli]|uniref:2OG-Fe(II) oxygenase n=1 Tax=Alterisphingorhabdus coralli TaxID=3071408 RepID=A0AA97F854_9SPHN|nr:putative 2OG-Fe(II) oxygenase [Parasphingorhabdus sp. SCSIO 66989]WOE75748.1 putative 2OG-Fe(II) oxygenase [Parasphingorhabdus sp. SCSIO 66989]